MIATLPRRSVWLVVVTLSSVLATEAALTQTRNAADGPWAGWVRCEIAAHGAGYTDRQTHTWIMAGGAPTVEGVFRIYPATWTVVGGGSIARTQATNVSGEWATNGQASNAPIAITTRGDGHLVFALRHGQLRAPNGFNGFRFYTVDGKDQPRQAITAETYEYRFQPIDDAPATSITGSSTVPIPSSNAYAPTPQPGSTATASCSWQFVQSAAPIAPPSTSSAAATATTSSPTTLRSAGSPTTIQSTAPSTTTSTERLRRDGAPSGALAAALNALAISGGATSRTITLAGFSAAGMFVPSRTITLNGITATGAFAPMPPRTITLPGWTSTGP